MWASRIALIAAAGALLAGPSSAQTDQNYDGAYQGGGYQGGGGGGYNGYQPAPGGYGGGGYGGYVAPGGAAPAGNPTVQMDQLQQQIQDLTGRIEELSHQLQVMSRRVTNLEQAPPAAPPQAAPQPVPMPPARLYPNAAETGAAPSGSPIYPPEPDDSGDYGTGPRQAYPPDNPANSGAAADPAPGDVAQLGAPPHALGTLPYAGGTPLAPRNGAAPADSAEAQYDQAIALLRSENYSGAQGAFKDFLAKNPTSPLAGNAQYWLGESYYAQGQYHNAAEAFLQGFQKYPKNSKASASLLKLGMSLGQLKQTKEACLTLNEIPKRYPDAPLMLRQRGQEERKKLHCP